MRLYGNVMKPISYVLPPKVTIKILQYFSIQNYEDHEKNVAKSPHMPCAKEKK